MEQNLSQVQIFAQRMDMTIDKSRSRRWRGQTRKKKMGAERCQKGRGRKDSNMDGTYQGESLLNRWKSLPISVEIFAQIEQNLSPNRAKSVPISVQIFALIERNLCPN
jgi:hypothetical protein